MRACSTMLAALIVLSAWASSAAAAVTIERLAINGGSVVLIVKGEFDRADDPSMLVREVTASGARTVTFFSNGGNVWAAMEFGGPSVASDSIPSSFDHPNVRPHVPWPLSVGENATRSQDRSACIAPRFGRRETRQQVGGGSRAWRGEGQYRCRVPHHHQWATDT